MPRPDAATPINTATPTIPSPAPWPPASAGAVQNVHTGNYAYGGRGAAYNPRTGMAAAGSRYTVGNAYSGHQATVGRGVVSGPGG